MVRRREAELYPPVKRLLEDQGYQVRAEVNSCDVVGVRGDEVVVVELKASFNLDIVLQGIQRQAIADNVYLAVEMPRNPVRGRNGRRWGDIRRLCRRLELGLIGVDFAADGPATQVVCDPSDGTIRKSRVKRAKLAAEFSQRSGDHNIGGTSRRPLVTAYREKALRLAWHLHTHGSAKPSSLRHETGIANAYGIVHRNVYGWFVKEEKALYGVSEAGRLALGTYAEVVSSLDSTRKPNPAQAAALAVATFLAQTGPAKLAIIADGCGVKRAGYLLQTDKSGWFERVSKGIYRVTEDGLSAISAGELPR